MFHYYVQTPYHETVFEIVTSVPLAINDLVTVSDFHAGIDDRYKVLEILHSASRNFKSHRAEGFISNQTYVKLEKIEA